MQWFKKHKILSVILILIVIIIVASAAAGGGKSGSDSATTTSSSTGSKKSTAPTVGIGQAANDGKFQFTVNSIKCGVPSVSQDEFLTATAQGQYCLLNVTAKNIGTEAQTFDATNQYVYDSAGNKLSADSNASDYANPSNTTFLEQINPGNSVTGVVAFDVAKTATITSAELHDSAFSGGVKVKLQ